MDLTSLFGSIDFSTANLVGGVALVVLSFLANGQLNRNSARREAKIRFVEDQIKELYGPLYAITKSNSTIYDKLKENDAEIDDESAAKRNLWNSAVFQPSNRRMRDVIEKNAHLFASETMPEAVIQFLAHVENWEALLEDESQNRAGGIIELISYPEEFPNYIAEKYEQISKRHAKLVGRSRS